LFEIYRSFFVLNDILNQESQDLNIGLFCTSFLCDILNQMRHVDIFILFFCRFLLFLSFDEYRARL